MPHKRATLWLSVLLLLAVSAHSQTQTCPVNINFSTGDLANWSASTGLVGGAVLNYPFPNNGVTTIPEYSLSNTGIQVITSSFSDQFGGFPTIPVINGYAYNYSVKLGSTTNSHDLNSTNRNPGGFTRAITYTINVPAGSATVPYTMTYAYALVLENGTHNSNQQPLFKATLRTGAGVITCASPEYYLPTLNNAGNNGGNSSTGATLDSAAALANGFTNSPVLFLSYSGTNNGGGTWLQDVWTKNWTEVTFDLSPYRGQQVTLTFEADNCTPGAHFAYAYVALRNTCAGLEISGSPTACTNSELTYSIPALAGATYNWTVPAGWTILSGANTNTIRVKVGNNGGNIIVQQANSCANLKDTLAVTTTLPTIAGQVNSDQVVCAGNNSTLLTAASYRGSILNWLSSTDGVNWSSLNITANSYLAQNLQTTTHYATLIQNGSTCSIDTGQAAIITVNSRSTGGNLSPASTNICQGEATRPTLQLNASNGNVVSWQSSTDNINWTNLAAAGQQQSYQPGVIATTTHYRVIVKSGVCPADTSLTASIHYFPTPIAAAAFLPDSASICYGKSAAFTASITTGTSYTWSNPSIVLASGNGTVPVLPYTIAGTVTPASSTALLLSVYNAGCPNAFTARLPVHVAPKISVFAGNDTSVVIGQPLQLQASSNSAEANIFSWTPVSYLNNAGIANPVATFTSSSPDQITYVATASTPAGCSGSDNITVKIFKTAADIFMPNAFTPNADGLNDVIMPVCVGITRLNYFRVFNRWGQLIFSTTSMGRGWDGMVGGQPQSSGNFVYMVQGVDYTGRMITKKGNILLVR